MEVELIENEISVCMNCFHGLYMDLYCFRVFFDKCKIIVNGCKISFNQIKKYLLNFFGKNLGFDTDPFLRKSAFGEENASQESIGYLLKWIFSEVSLIVFKREKLLCRIQGRINK